MPCKECDRLTNEKDVVSYRLYDQVINQQFTRQDLRNEFEREMQIQKENARNVAATDLEKLEPSRKMIQCMDVIKKVFENSDTEKIIIFSQFTSFFDIFQHFLEKLLKVPYLKYTGAMTAQQRADVITKFYRQANERILLISMKAGNSGLTLTCANHVIICLLYTSRCV